MTETGKKYRFLSDEEPDEKDLEFLMHEVAVDAKRKSEAAEVELQKRIKFEVSAALAREGF